MSAFGGVVTCVSIIDSLKDLVIGGLIWNLYMVDHVIERWKQNKSPIQAILTLHYSYIVSLTLFCGSLIAILHSTKCSNKWLHAQKMSHRILALLIVFGCLKHHLVKLAVDFNSIYMIRKFRNNQ